MTQDDLKINPHTKKYIVTFKRKNQREDKKSDKVDILKGLMVIPFLIIFILYKVITSFIITF
jgi:hypothetical protein